MNNSKTRKDNKGFTMIELLIAIGIMSVVIVTVGTLMTTSSRTFNALGTETKLQSEAQLVANSISNLAMDSISANSTAPSDIPDSSDYNLASGKALVLKNNVDKSRYTIVCNPSENKLYYYKQTINADDSLGSYSDKSLLAENVHDFSVNTSRVDTENIIDFTLTYERKSGPYAEKTRSYTGNYQVLMRNRNYVARTLPTTPAGTPSLRGLTLLPNEVIVSVKNNHIWAVQARNATGLSTLYPSTGTVGAPTYGPDKYDASILLEANAIYNGDVSGDADAKLVDWKLSDNADISVVSVSRTHDKDTDLKIDVSGKAGKFNDLTSFNFYVAASKGAFSKKTNVKIQMVSNMTLRATSGTKPWKDAYLSSPYNGKKAVGVDNNNYIEIGKSAVVMANVEQKNVTSNYIWGLYYASSDAACTDPSDAGWNICPTDVATLTYNNDLNPRTDADGNLIGTTTPTNLLQIGSKAGVDRYKFQVRVMSEYDNTVKAYMNFGVVPAISQGQGGFNSRGFYMDLNEYMRHNHVHIQGDLPEIYRIINFELCGGDNMDQNDVNQLKDAIRFDSTKGTLFIDYGVFQYSKQQSVNFFTSKRTFYFTNIEYECKDCPNCYKDNQGNRYADYDASKGHHIKTSQKDLYHIEPTDVKASGSNTVCVKKGSDTEFFTQFEYNNIYKKSFIGIYVKPSGATAFSSNINQSGMEASDKYLKITFNEAELGTVYNYVDTVKFSVEAKNNLKTYPINAITVRTTFEEFYQMAKDNDKSYEDYNVYVVNLEAQNVYIPGPNAIKVADPTTQVGWPSTTVDSTGATVKVVKADGATGGDTAVVKKSGNTYECTYNGQTYTYNKSYDCWR